MTERLYYHDSFLYDFEAEVEEIPPTERPSLVLNRTAFYPTSGGQVHDIGWILAADQKSRVTEVADTEDGRIVHYLEAPPGIFAIHSDEFDGFQYQDPSAKPKSILMDLFAQDRGLEFIFLSSYKESSPHLSQADINRIVRTIHKVGPYPAIKQTSLTQQR